MKQSSTNLRDHRLIVSRNLSRPVATIDEFHHPFILNGHKLFNDTKKGNALCPS